jgi:hypothetical protein
LRRLFLFIPAADYVMPFMAMMAGRFAGTWLMNVSPGCARGSM